LHAIALSNLYLSFSAQSLTHSRLTLAFDLVCRQGGNIDG
jgi:hypothetical protein